MLGHNYPLLAVSEVLGYSYSGSKKGSVPGFRYFPQNHSISPVAELPNDILPIPEVLVRFLGTVPFRYDYRINLTPLSFSRR